MKHVGLGVALALVAVVLAPAAKAQGIGSLPDSAGRIFIDGCSFLSPSGSGWSRDPDNDRYFMKTLSKDRDSSHVISVGVRTWPQDEIKDRDELLALMQRDLKAPPAFKIFMGSREGIDGEAVPDSILGLACVRHCSRLLIEPSFGRASVRSIYGYRFIHPWAGVVVDVSCIDAKSFRKRRALKACIAAPPPPLDPEGAAFIRSLRLAERDGR